MDILRRKKGTKREAHLAKSMGKDMGIDLIMFIRSGDSSIDLNEATLRVLDPNSDKECGLYLDDQRGTMTNDGWKARTDVPNQNASPNGYEKRINC
ncbi:unnamed protein product [Nippostrongylus brasiliensis]|uniref:Transposase n=1 Tax=Nippostrongylus brasiliensis TaxID=27835 RepID=A0A0N4YPW4_NIPBR|nr:hypothetical protein Q1695_002594 [Nippostrongylus brasiliensis]VDL83015.1 unnamed protein product [Nippostrongylus brasiliensis]